MQNNITCSLLLWDNIESIPIPSEVLEFPKVDWSKQEWQVLGLPLHFAKYSILSKQLYLDELPNGDAKVEKQDFTGLIKIGTYVVNPDPKGLNYFISFLVTFCRGEVLEVKEDVIHKQENQEYQKQLEVYSANVKSRIKRNNAWWYRWIYRPYLFILKFVFFLPMALVYVCGFLVQFIFDLLTLEE